MFKKSHYLHSSQISDLRTACQHIPQMFMYLVSICTLSLNFNSFADLKASCDPLLQLSPLCAIQFYTQMVKLWLLTNTLE